MNLNRREFTFASLGAMGALASQTVWSAEPATNRRFVLASRPAGKPTVDNFRLEEVPVPVPDDIERPAMVA